MPRQRTDTGPANRRTLQYTDRYLIITSHDPCAMRLILTVCRKSRIRVCLRNIKRLFSLFLALFVLTMPRLSCPLGPGPVPLTYLSIYAPSVCGGGSARRASSSTQLTPTKRRALHEALAGRVPHSRDQAANFQAQFLFAWRKQPRRDDLLPGLAQHTPEHIEALCTRLVAHPLELRREAHLRRRGCIHEIGRDRMEI